MQIDFSCPIELLKSILPKTEADVCVFTLNNVSRATITTIEILLSCVDATGREVLHQTETIQDLSVKNREHFEVTIRPLEWQDVQTVNLQIAKVWFEDGTEWSRGNAPLFYYEPNTLPNGRDLERLRFVAGEDAAGYPSRDNSVWVCVCGRANHITNPTCSRCARGQTDVFEHYQRMQVEQLIQKNEELLKEDSRKAIEGNNVLQQNREREYSSQKRKKKKTVRVIVCSLLLCLAVAALVLFGIPELKYRTAVDLQQKGSLDEAYATFAQLGDYRDSAQLALSCVRMKADNAFALDTTEGYQQAIELYASLNGALDGDIMVNKSKYALAQRYAKDGSFERAAEQYQELGSYSDSKEKKNEVILQQACAMIDGKSYAAARILLKGIPQTEAVIEKMNECTYEIGKSYLQDNNWTDAIEELSSLGDYRDADTLRKQADYSIGSDLLLRGDKDQALESFIKADDYEDAANQAKECAYSMAGEAMLAKDWERAVELYQFAGDYLDSSEQMNVCISKQADEFLAEGNTEAAVSLLSQIDANQKTEEIIELEKAINYQLAMTALNEGDYETAEDLLEEAGDYQDSQKQLRIARYALASDDMKAGEYERAFQRFVLLGNYKTSATDAKACRYQLGLSALEKGEYDQAIELFSELSGYKQSEKKLQEAQYQKGMQLKSSGSDAEAKELLSGIETRDAKDAMDEITLQEGLALEKEGKWTEAIAIYEGLNDSELKKTRLSACRYGIAREEEDKGEYFSAAEKYYAVGNYEDAAQKSDECFARVYADAPDTARRAAEAGDSHAVVKTLYCLPLTENSYSFADLPLLFHDALIKCADTLYKSGKAYVALPYYQALMEIDEAAAKEKLNRRAYLIIGKWKTSSGADVEFRTDDTCTLPDGEHYFRVNNFSLYLGEDTQNLSLGFQLNSVGEKEMSMSDLRGVKTVDYHLTRVGEWSLPEIPLPESQSTEFGAEDSIQEADATEEQGNGEPKE